MTNAANDVLSVDEAIVLVDEIKRLRTELATAEARLAELEDLAHHDPLLNLPNRRSFLISLERLIGRVERHGGSAAMLFVDVDGLKAINDRFGHGVGDKALVQIGQLLVASVRKSDFVGRLAGDEFGILLEHADELSAWQTALRVTETVDECKFWADGVWLPLSVATGVGTIYAGDTPEVIFARADKAMYQIKAASGPLLFAG